MTSRPDDGRKMKKAKDSHAGPLPKTDDVAPSFEEISRMLAKLLGDRK